MQKAVIPDGWRPRRPYVSDEAALKAFSFESTQPLASDKMKTERDPAGDIHAKHLQWDRESGCGRTKRHIY
jgi:hypothetical protein